MQYVLSKVWHVIHLNPTFWLRSQVNPRSLCNRSFFVGGGSSLFCYFAFDKFSVTIGASVIRLSQLFSFLFYSNFAHKIRYFKKCRSIQWRSRVNIRWKNLSFSLQYSLYDKISFSLCILQIDRSRITTTHLLLRYALGYFNV